MKKKKGIANKKLNTANRTEKWRAFSLNKTFFSAIAAAAEKNAEVNARMCHGIILFFSLDIYHKVCKKMGHPC